MGPPEADLDELARDIARCLFEAMDGLGTDEAAIYAQVDRLESAGHWERVEAVYREVYNRSLDEHLDSELSGDEHIHFNDLLRKRLVRSPSSAASPAPVRPPTTDRPPSATRQLSPDTTAHEHSDVSDLLSSADQRSNKPSRPGSAAPPRGGDTAHAPPESPVRATPALRTTQISQRLHDAVDGLGTDEDAVFAELGAVGTREEWADVQDTYKSSYGRPLVAVLTGELSDAELRRCRALLRENGIAFDAEYTAAGDIVAGLYGAMQGLGTDEADVFRYLALVDTEEKWDDVKDLYHTTHGKDLPRALRDELSDAELRRGRALLCERGIAFDAQEMSNADIARALHEAVYGAGTDEVRVCELLRRVRHEGDWEECCEVYAAKYGMRLWAALADEMTRGELQRCRAILHERGVELPADTTGDAEIDTPAAPAEPEPLPAAGPADDAAPVAQEDEAKAATNEEQASTPALDAADARESTSQEDDSPPPPAPADSPPPPSDPVADADPAPATPQDRCSDDQPPTASSADASEPATSATGSPAYPPHDMPSPVESNLSSRLGDVPPSAPASPPPRTEAATPPPSIPPDTLDVDDTEPVHPDQLTLVESTHDPHAHFGARKRRHVLKASRDNAINNIALKTLLQAKRAPLQPRHTTSLVPAEMFGASVRSLQMLSYLRQTTSQVYTTHLDLSNANVEVSDLAVLRAVLSNHPNITSLDFTGVRLGPQGARDMVDLVAANPAICVLQWADGPEWAVKAIEQQLSENRDRSKHVVRQRNAAVRKKTKKWQNTVLVRLLTRLMADEEKHRTTVLGEEARAREGARQYLAHGARRIIVVLERRAVREAREAAMAHTVGEECIERMVIEGEEENEMCILMEMQEYALRREHQNWVQAECMRLKRLELTSWSEHKRAERMRKQAELEARAAAEDDFLAARDALWEEFEKSLADLALEEAKSREEALERQTEREDKERSAAQWRKRMAEEALEKELWLKKQAELELEMKRTQLQKQRDAIAREEHKARMQLCVEHEDIMTSNLVFNQIDELVSRSVEKVRKLEAERRQLGNMPPTLKLSLSGPPSVYYIGDPYPLCPLREVSLSMTLQGDFAAKVRELDKNIKAAHEELKRTVEHANRECGRESSRNEATFTLTLRKLINHTKRNETACSMFDEGVMQSEEWPAQHLAGVAAAVATVVLAAESVRVATAVADKLVKKAQRRSKLKDAVKANRAEIYKVYQVPPLHVTFDVAAEALAEEKQRVMGVNVTVHVEDRLDMYEERVYVEASGRAQRWDIAEQSDSVSVRPSRSPSMSPAAQPAQNDVTISIEPPEDPGLPEAESVTDGDGTTGPPLSPRLAGMSSTQSMRMHRLCASAASQVEYANLKQLRDELGGKSPTELQRAMTMDEFLDAEDARAEKSVVLRDKPHPLEGTEAVQPLRFEAEMTTVDGAVEAMQKVFYRLGCSAGVFQEDEPMARRLTYRVELLHPGNTPEDAHVVSVAEATVMVHLMRPLLRIPPGAVGHKPVEYVEDSHPDACKPLHDVVVEDACQLIWNLDVPRKVKTTYHNYTLRLEIDEGYTNDDCLLFSFSERVYFREVDRKDILRGLSDFGPEGLRLKPPPPTTDTAWCVVLEDREVAGYPVVVGEVVKGHMLTVGRQPYVPIKRNSKIWIRLYTSLITPCVLMKLLKRIRFGNFSQDPEEGRRHLHCSIVDIDGNASGVNARIDVIPTDDATTMELACHKLQYRCITYPTIPKVLKRLLSLQYIKPFLGVRVEDVDTTTFVGGYSKCVLQNPQKGDLLFLAAPCVTTQGESDELGGALHVLDLGVTDRRLIVDRVCVGVLVHGVVYDPALGRDGLEPAVAAAQARKTASDANDTIAWLFDDTGIATIGSCGVLLEAVCFASSLFRPKDVDRQLSVCLQVGPSFDKDKDSLKAVQVASFDSPLEDKVVIKVLPELFSVSDCQHSYREGSGYVRIAPFEVTAGLDHVFTGGFISVDIVEGSGPTDYIGVKDNADMRFVQVDDASAIVEKALEDNSKTCGGPLSLQPVSPTAADRRAADAGNASQGNKLRMAGHKLITAARLGSRPDDTLRADDSVAISRQASMSAANQRLTEGLASGQALWFEVYSSVNLIGYMQLTQHKAMLYVTGSGVKKKDVNTAMRCLTYANTALNFDDQEMQKYLRVQLSDGRQSVSEAIIHIDVQEVDDVTEVVARRKRLCYRQGTVEMADDTPFPLAPVGEAWLQDPDTEWFTGGYVSVALDSGHTKNEVLQFMSVERQRAVRATQARDPECPYSIDEFPDLVVQEDSTIVCDLPADDEGGEVRTVVLGKLSLPKCPSWAPSNNLRVDFTKEEKIVSLKLATCVVNCVEYMNHAIDKQALTTRQYVIGINDGTNPAMGREKIAIDVVLPALQPPPAVVRGQKPPFTYADDLTAGLNVVTPLFAKAQVNWVAGYCSQRGLTSTAVQLDGGWLSVAVVEGFKTGDYLMMKKEPNSAVKREVTPELLRLDFAGSKTKARDIGDIVRGLSIKAAFAGTRVIKITLCDSTQCTVVGVVNVSVQ